MTNMVMTWRLTRWLTRVADIVVAKLMGVMHMEVDKVPEMMMDMKVDKVADKCSYLAQFSNGSGSG